MSVIVVEKEPLEATHLTPTQLAARLHVTISCLNSWRTKGEGPKFLKLPKQVVYPIAEVEAWEREHVKGSTSE